MTTGEWIHEMTDRIARQFDPERIVLFGSHATGEAGPHSDVDLLVVLPGVVDHHKATASMHRALCDCPVPKDIIVATPEEIERWGEMVGTILRPALRQGVVLYERH